MMKRLTLAASAAAIALTAVLAAAPVFSKDEASVAGLEIKMKQVLENQDKIMQALEEIKKELQIVKIRATR